MKSLFVVMFSVLTLLPSVGYTASAVSIKLSSAVDLTINAPSAEFRVDYPGLGEKAVCSLGLKLDPSVFNTVDVLPQIFEVTEVFSNEVLPITEVNKKISKVDLQLGLYVTIVSISTRDGRTLREVLNENGIYKNHLILVGNPCPQK